MLYKNLIFNYTSNFFTNQLNTTDGFINLKKRNKKYKEWIDHLGVKDKIVADIGSGTGIWGYYALGQGAKHVIQIEFDPVKTHFLNHLKENSEFKDKITVITADLTEDFNCHLIPEVVIGELIGSKIYNEKFPIIYPLLKTKWPNALFVTEYGQFEINWIEVSFKKLQLYHFLTKECLNFKYEPHIDMPECWVSKINELYDSFKNPITAMVHPESFLNGSEIIHTEKCDVFSFCDQSIPFEIKPTYKNNNQKLFAVLQLNIGVEKDNLHPAYDLGLGSPHPGYATIVDKQTRINFKYDKFMNNWNVENTTNYQTKEPTTNDVWPDDGLIHLRSDRY